MTHLPFAYDQERGEVAVARLAARQHGLVTSAQLHRCGLSDTAIRRRVQAGRLHRVHRGVYAVGHPGLTPPARDMAAVLACGAGAALSHWSAAALWRMRGRYHGPVHVTAPVNRRSRRGIVVHVGSAATTTRDGIPVTTPEQTLTDCADTATPSQLRRLLETAERLGLVDRRDLVPPPGRRRVVRAPHRFTRSELERRVLRLIRDAGLPVPETNVIVHGWEVDCLWRDRRAVLEVDCYATHGDPAAFERDRRKQNDLEERGYRVRRVTDVQLDERPAEAERVIRRLVDPRTR